MQTKYVTAYGGRSLMALFIALCLPTTLLGQGANASFAGSVQDTTGAVIPNATVTVTNVETGVTYEAETGINGSYLIANLPAATYNIAAQSEGFKRQEIQNIRLNANTQVTQTFRLEVGAVTETIEVSAQALQVQTTSGQVGSTVQVEQIQELPLPNRDVFNLINLVPGAFRSEENGNLSIGGSRTRSTLAMIDGINNSRGGLGVQNVEMAPPVDSMQEFKVEVNSMGAEYGRSAAGFINAVTRSGTNRWRGSVYEFLRNDKLDAAGWNNDTKPTLRRNNFGGTIGGPILENKTFFFYNADLFRQRLANPITRSVGLPAWRTGDFSTATRKAGSEAKLVPIYDPQTRTGGTFIDPRGTSPFPGNIIPPSRLDPVALKAIQFIPDPNRSPNNPFNNQGNYQENVPDKRDRDYHTIRVDHTFNNKWRSYVRYIFTNPDDSIDEREAGYGEASFNQLSIINRRKNAVLNNTFTFSPTFFVSTQVGFNRVTIRRKAGNCCEKNYADFFGLPGLEKGGEMFPRFNFNGGKVPVNQIGARGNGNRIAAFTNFDFEANFTQVRGNHTFKFGGKYTAFQGNEVNRKFASGVWRFNGNYTRSRALDGRRDPNTGINFADFLLGRVWNLDTEVAQGIGKRIKYFAGYFQDDWRVTPRLTLNIGLRYETETPIREVADRMNGFCLYCPQPRAGIGDIPENAIGMFLFPNRNTGKYLWQWDKNNFAPRFGFAYRVKEDDSLVVRGGFGIFFGNPYDRNSIQPARSGFANVFRVRGGYDRRLRDGVPAGALDNIPESELNGGFGTRGTRFEQPFVRFWDQKRVTPYAMNFNLTLQNRWKGILWEYGVLGNLARHQSFNGMNLNQIPKELLPRTEIPERFRRIWNAWPGNQNDIRLMAPNYGVSNYYAFTFKSEKRYSSGLGWTIAYTHTQWIDNVRFINDADAFGDADRAQDVFNLAAERSSSTNRLPHRLVLAPIWDLPFGHGRKWGHSWNSVLNAIAGGWQVSTIGTLRSGGYFGIEVQNGPEIRGDTAAQVRLRPNLTGEPFAHSKLGEPAPGGIIGRYWLNPDAFATPEPFTLGNASRTLPGIRGPKRTSFDLMVAKNFRWGERYRLQYRWEMFNFTNTPAWDLPNQSLGSSNFSFITAAGGRRIMQMGLKLQF